MKIEELICRHFRRKTVEGSSSKDPGASVDAGHARKLCEMLSPRQRASLDEQTLAALSDLLEEDESQDEQAPYSRDYKKLKSFAWFKARKRPDLERSLVALVVVHRLVLSERLVGGLWLGRNLYAQNAIQGLAEILQKRAIKLSAEQALTIIESSVRSSPRDQQSKYEYQFLSSAVSALHEHRADLSLSSPDAQMLTELGAQCEKFASGGDVRAYANMLGEILAGGEEQAEEALLWEGESWAEAINQALAAAPAEKRRAMAQLLKHAGTSNPYSAKPTKQWIAAGEKLVTALNDDAAECLARWLNLFAGVERDSYVEFMEQHGRRFGDPRFQDVHKFCANSGYITGLAQLARLCPSERVLSSLCDVVERVAGSRHVVRQHSACVATAAIRSIESCDHPAAGAALSRLALRVRWPKLRKAVEKSLDAYLKRTGMNRDDLEETSVPVFGLKNGVKRVEIGEAFAEIVIAKGPRPRVVWHQAGKESTHVTPRALKQQHSAEVKAVVAEVDEIEKMLATQRTRIDLLFRRETSWRYDEWRKRYLDHGLLGSMVRRLIWLIDGVPLFFCDDAWTDVTGEKIEIGQTADVKLWHPIGRSADEIVAWRSRLESLEITQPIKQAHREIYILTDAERTTHTYSNRFAAHILKNQATLAISQVRKWKMGLYGGASSPSLALPHFQLRAEWWASAAGADHDRMGFPLYLVSDQVRFYRIDETQPMPLEQVPPLALTEVMRDVDLFVSIASVGADPQWRDQGPAEGRYHDYWRQYSFGELTETAKTRKAVLERLVPRLKIASRCAIDGKFLSVRGDIRTYKIHLGSGNILMEPNDQYLCIVPDRSPAANDVFLPFEGDSTLSLIVSKAFLLAEDAKISDPTIVRQIR